MFKEGSKIYGITKMKCPKCHQGDLFETKNLYDIKNMSKMHSHCPVCKQTYNPEPNFYYGAMYMSYVYSVGIFIMVYVLTSIFFDLTVWETIAVLTSILVLLSPLMFRLSRASYIHIFIHYDPKIANAVRP